ncbi:Acyl-COA dehydrogenase [Gracilaria domingensis]|nr:Acyl-COA dehydrogenase [Gracilaria domingensis]
MVAKILRSRALEDMQCSGLLYWAVSGGVAALAERGFHPTKSAISVTQFDHGQSNPTYLVTITNVDRKADVFKFVIRSQPKGKLLKGAHRIDREFRVLSALAFSPVPVPQVYGFCEDKSLLGVPFYAMSYVEGRIFKDVSLSEVQSAAERAEVFSEALRVLAALRQVDINRYGLQGLSSTRTLWIDRQLATWYRQYRASRVAHVDYTDIELLYRTLKSERNQVTQSDVENGYETGLIHGDFRLDNLVFHKLKPVCLAVLDWELVSLGNPIADLASFLTPYHMPKEASCVPILRSMAFNLPRPSGIPEESDILAQYLKDTRVEKDRVLSELRIYLSFALFKFAAIIYGIQHRIVQGNAASTHATVLVEQVHCFVRGGLDVLGMSSKLGFGKYSSSGSLLLSKVISFITQEVAPLEENYLAHIRSSKRWEPWEPLETLKLKAKDAGLWNFFLPKSLGGALSAVEYAPIAEMTGRYLFGAEVFNCSAPDTAKKLTSCILYDARATGNIELLSRFGNERQKQRWLIPLLNGEIRSCFAMTEPEVASSDATNLSTRIESNGTEYCIRGRKWWASGAMDKRCKVILLIGKGPDDVSKNAKHKQHSIVLIPMSTPGVRVLRPLMVFGYDDAPHGHAEIEFDNVRVDISEALLHVEGGGFEVAQSRLGGGRLHHCMRLIGCGERALELLINRSRERYAFGQALIKNDAVQQQIGECRCKLEAARGVTLRAASLLDSGNVQETRRLIGVAKVIVPQLISEVVDRAIQVHGGLGVCQDSILSIFFVHARTLRIADGPDEAHLLNLAEMEVKSRAKL